MCWVQIHTADGEARSEKRFEVLNAAIENGKISIAGAFGELLSLLKTSEPEKAAAVRAHFHKILRVYFDKYDRSADGHIDERCVLLRQYRLLQWCAVLRCIAVVSYSSPGPRYGAPF